MFAIIKATFKETLNKKIFHLILILTIVYLSIFSLLIFLMVNDLQKHDLSSFTIFINVSALISIIGFYFSSMITSFLTIMLSIGTISSDIENGTIQTIISKPIRREEYVLGKYIGTALLVTVYSIFLYFLIIIIPNLINPTLISTFGTNNLLKGLFFFILQPLVILSIALYGSSSFKTLNNGIFVIAIYILALLGGIMEQIGSTLGNTKLINFGILSSLVSPIDTVYRKMLSVIFTNISFKGPLPGPALLAGSVSTPSIWMMIYVFIYLALLIFLAVRKFDKKDI